jgi:feruloyl-CoA synthase
VPPDVEVVLGEGAIEGRATTPLAQLLRTQPTPAVDAAMQRTGPDTITKFLFTSARPSCPRR